MPSVWAVLRWLAIMAPILHGAKERPEPSGVLLDVGL